MKCEKCGHEQQQIKPTASGEQKIFIDKTQEEHDQQAILLRSGKLKENESNFVSQNKSYGKWSEKQKSWHEALWKKYSPEIENKNVYTTTTPMESSEEFPY